MKDPRVEKSKKPQEPKVPALQRSKNVETSEKAQKKKKNNCRHQCGHRAPKDIRPQEGSTIATKVKNTSTAGGETLRRNQNKGARQDSAQVICWNCNKKGNYTNKCPEPQKPKN